MSHSVRVGFLTGRTLLPFYAKSARRQLLPFYVNFRLVAFTDLPPKEPKFFPPARCARPHKRTAHNTPPRRPLPHDPLPAWRPCPSLPVSPPAHPSHVVLHHVEVDSGVLRCGIPRSLGVARLLPLLYSFTGE